MTAKRITVKSPLGPLTIIELDGKIAALDYAAPAATRPRPCCGWRPSSSMPIFIPA